MTYPSIPSDRPLYWPDIVEELADILAEHDIWLVGGIVRDVYLRKPVHDIDLTTAEDGRQIARKIANALNGHFYVLDDERRVGRAIIQWMDTRFTIDVAQFRENDLIADLVDRDLTANALAVHLHQRDHIIDPTNGLDDIRKKLVRPCTANAITNDPVRALRAVRLAVSHKFHLTSEVKAACRDAGPLLKKISKERIRDEFFKILDLPQPKPALMSLDVLGLLSEILPETQHMKGVQQSAPHIFDVWRHTLHVVENMGILTNVLSNRRDDNTSANFSIGLVIFTFSHIRSELVDHLRHEWPQERSHRALLILAALAHDIAKPLTQTIDENGNYHFYQHEVMGTEIAKQWAERLALSNVESERLQTIVRHHLRPRHLQASGSVSKRAVYRFWRDTGIAGIDVCLHSIVDQLGKFGNTLDQEFWIEFMNAIQFLLEGYFNTEEPLINIKPLLNGNDLMSRFDIHPGPILGHLIADLKEAQALKAFSDHDGAIAWVEEWLKTNQDDA